jgi:hypothetical protein
MGAAAFDQTPPLERFWFMRLFHFSFKTTKIVIPAKAGIHAAYPPSRCNQGSMDSRLRGNDDVSSCLFEVEIE